jgi:uncharacterized Fe-S cluster protein YjdI
MRDITKKYSNGEITIVWKPQMCIHSTICWKATTGLPDVFNPAEHPWIKPENASTAELVAQVSKCPSGALTYVVNEAVTQVTDVEGDTIIETAPNGPLLVYGNITIKNKNGQEEKRHKVTAFCRCGASSNKPYCDGTHIKIGFEG